jgi:NADH:ubiquinone oxidoreductase subunit 4 (subunit M)
VRGAAPSCAPAVGVAGGVVAFSMNLPALVCLVGVLAYPIGYAAYVSVHDVSVRQRRSGEMPEAGLSNFARLLALVPPLGIKYQLAVDGMSLLMVLLTSIIIFAGSFASWTVKERSQEFYALLLLLLLLVTGVYGVFVSLDLFVLFLFYEIAVLPMYLLIGIWGSSGEVRPQGIFACSSVSGRSGRGSGASLARSRATSASRYADRLAALPPASRP